MQNKKTKEHFILKLLDSTTMKPLNEFKNIQNQNQEVILNLLKIIDEN